MDRPAAFAAKRHDSGHLDLPAGLQSLPAVILLICFSSALMLQSPGVWLGGYSFNASTNFAARADLQTKVTRVLDDGALDDAEIMKQVREKFEIELLTPHNPRARKPIRDNLPRGVDHIPSLGVPVCAAGIPLDFLGCRHQDERFRFRAPDDEDGTPVCAACPKAPSCLRKGSERRHVTIPFNQIPFIDPERPHLSRRHQMYTDGQARPWQTLHRGIAGGIQGPPGLGLEESKLLDLLGGEVEVCGGPLPRAPLRHSPRGAHE